MKARRRRRDHARRRRHRRTPPWPRVVATVHARAGHVTGVIHSAGILRDALIALRTPNAVSPVVDVKAKGAMVLQRVLAKDPPDLFVLCSSVSSIIGLPGQVDYTAANAFLDAFAAQGQPGGSHPGGGRQLERVAGRRHGRRGHRAPWSRRTACPSPSSPPASAVELFDHVVDDGDEVVLQQPLSRTRNWLLGEHVIRGGDALMPGTGFLEITRSAAAWGPAVPHPVELRDVFFISSFAVATDEARVLKVKYDRPSSIGGGLQRCRGRPPRHRHRPHGGTRRRPPPRPRRHPRPLRPSASTSFDGYSEPGVHGLRAALGQPPPGAVRPRARRSSPPSCRRRSRPSWSRCGCTRPCSTWPPAAPRP